MEKTLSTILRARNPNLLQINILSRLNSTDINKLNYVNMKLKTQSSELGTVIFLDHNHCRGKGFLKLGGAERGTIEQWDMQSTVVLISVLGMVREIIQVT